MDFQSQTSEQMIARAVEELRRCAAAMNVLLVDKKGGLHDLADMIVIDAYKATDDEIDDLEYATDSTRREKARRLNGKLDDRAI